MFICHVCPELFSSDADVQAHLSTAHAAASPQPPSINPELVLFTDGDLDTGLQEEVILNEEGSSPLSSHQSPVTFNDQESEAADDQNAAPETTLASTETSPRKDDACAPNTVAVDEQNEKVEIAVRKSTRLSQKPVKTFANTPRAKPPEDGYKCTHPNCSHTEKFKVPMLTHIRSHLPVCSLCGRHVKSIKAHNPECLKKKLKEEKLAKLAASALTTKQPTSVPNLFCCNFAGCRFQASATNLAKHTLAVHGTALMVAATGGKKHFLTAMPKDPVLASHLLNEPQHKKCPWPKCGRVFVSDSFLKLHVKMNHLQHVKCAGCGRFYDSKELLTNHLKVIAPQSGWMKCGEEDCPVASTSSTVLLKHWCQSHQFTPICCELCSVVAKCDTAFQMHMQQSHPKAIVDDKLLFWCKQLGNTEKT